MEVGRRRKRRPLAEEGCCLAGMVGECVYWVVGVIGFDEVVVENDEG